MVGQDFLFANKHLRDFGFIMAQPSEDDESGLNREIIKGTTTMHRSQAVHYGSRYSGVITLPFFIVKFDCDYDDTQISLFELRRIQTWLTSTKLPQSLHLISYDGSTIEYRGIFTEISPFVYNGLNGLNLQFTCDSPFAYDTKTVIMSSYDANEHMEKMIYCNTDETDEYIYPLIKFYPNEAGEITLKNNNDNENIMTLKIPEKYKEVIIDCKLRRIIADGLPLSMSSVGFNMQQINDYNNVNTGIYKMYWFRLKSEENYIDISGNGTFNITYKNLLKIGGLSNV